MRISRRDFFLGGASMGTLALLPTPARAQVETILLAMGAVGNLLVQGAIQYVGGKLMAAALGDNGGIDFSDIKTWIDQAVTILEQFVSAELKKQLDAKVMEQMQADLQGIVDDIKEYASLSQKNQLKNRFLIEQCDIKTAELVPLSYNYDQSFFVTTVAMGYRLFSRFALYQLDGDKGHIISLQDMVDGFVKNMSDARDRLSKALSPDTRTTRVCGDDPAGNEIYVNGHWGKEQGCMVYYDGQQAWWIGHQQTVEAAQQASDAALNAYRAEADKPYEAFVSSSAQSIQLAAQCYNNMRQKAKLSPYPIPPFPQVKNVPKFQQPFVSMPGAIIRSPNAL